jgi:uncharacterized membrane protein HdeD (DUF308 family)
MTVLAGNWWTFVLRGIVAILFGIMAIVMPGMALVTLVLLFGVYAMIEGVLNLIAAFQREAGEGRTWWSLLFQGVLSIIAALVAFLLPGLTALGLLLVIAFWAITRGIVELVAAVRLRKQIRGEWMLALSGILSIVFGVLVAMFPGAGALAVVLWIGVYAIVLGVLLIALGTRLRTWIRSGERHPPGFPTTA